MITTRPRETAPARPPRPYVEPPLVDRLSSAMRELAFAGQTVDLDTLALKGFTTDEIDQNFRKARDLATRQSIRRLDQ